MSEAERMLLEALASDQHVVWIIDMSEPAERIEWRRS